MRAVFTGRAFARAARAAQRLVASGTPLGRVLAATATSLRGRRRPLRVLLDDVLALLRLVREVVAGRYRKLPKGALVAIVAGLIYFVDPLDLIPDEIPVIGFLDDALVLGWVLSRVRGDLEAFLAWEAGSGPIIDVEPLKDATG
jgi:uncharacterized membrane protein YkvA (DUF1232 family)